MADLTKNQSEFSSGTIDTATTLQDEGVSQQGNDVKAAHVNGPNSAIIQIETILGNATDLIGTVANVAARLLVALEANGKVKDFSATTKTTHPGTVTEGMTGATSFTNSEIIRKHASNDVLESTGLTVRSGTSGHVVTEDSTQTLTNKTHTTPTIGSFTNAQHDHNDAAGGGGIAASHINRSRVSTSTSSVSGNVRGAAVEITLSPYSFFPMIHVSAVNDGGGILSYTPVLGHSTDGASADAPRFRLEGPNGASGGDYDIDHRFIQT